MLSINEFVDREVHYNCSQLISELAKNESNKCFDELLSISSQADYKTAALEDGWEVIERNDGITVIVKNDQFIYDPQSNVVDRLDQVGPIEYEYYEIEDDRDVWRSLCDYEGIDPYQHEALEHWIVSDWLAKKLEQYGEMVGDIHGLTVWGRCCSGQAIAYDYVIQQIYQDTRI